MRLFTAVRPDETILARLLTLQDELRSRVDSSAVRWVPANNIHLTLHFLGDTPDELLPDVRRALHAGLSQVDAGGDVRIHRSSMVSTSPDDGPTRANNPPPVLTVEGVGVFPRISSPRVIWAGASDEDMRLAAIQFAIGRALAAAGVPFDRKPFRPHITLGYVRRRATRPQTESISAAVRQVNAMGAARTAVFEATEILLVRSDLSPGGASYTTVYSEPLSEARVSTSSGDSALA